jgi:hypothetical protein
MNELGVARTSFAAPGRSHVSRRAFALCARSLTAPRGELGDHHLAHVVPRAS